MYETTLLLKGIGQAEGQVLTLSSGEQVYLSLPLAPGQERLTLYNTPAGEYSEGVLLPHLPSYQVSLETGEGRAGRSPSFWRSRRREADIWDKGKDHKMWIFSLCRVYFQF